MGSQKLNRLGPLCRLFWLFSKCGGPLFDEERSDLRSFANMFASYLETSFDLVEAPGQTLYSPDDHCFCSMCSWLVAAPRLKTKKLGPSEKRRAKSLQLEVVRRIARELNVELTDDQAGALLAHEDLNDAAALVAYALELERRMDDAGVGRAGLALWRTFAWNRQGSPRHDFNLTAQLILDADAALATAVRVLYRMELAAPDTLSTPADAMRLLHSLGAHVWLVRHHELVVEAAEQLCDRVARTFSSRFDRRLVLLGAALHDAGKVVHPEEMREPGASHEAAGQQLLVERGVDPSIARFCVTHAAWSDTRCTIEDLVVALADKLWKGKRDEALELAFAERLAADGAGELWSVVSRLDAICEGIADDGPGRLARSDV